MISFISTPARKREPRATANHTPRVQPVHGRNCICHRCKAHPNDPAAVER
jgi:hypothetical protein